LEIELVGPGRKRIRGGDGLISLLSTMLSSLIKTLVNKFLNEYVEGDFDIGISLFGKHAFELEHLEVKCAEVNRIVFGQGLPFRFKKLYVGHVAVEIPFASLGSRPVRAFVSDVLVVLEAKLEEQSWDEKQALEEMDETLKAFIETLLNELHPGRSTGTLGQGPSIYFSSEGMLNRTITRIIDNIEVNVKNLDARFETPCIHQSSFHEGTVLHGGFPRTWDVLKEDVSVLELGIKTISVVTTDKDWKRSFDDDCDYIVFKVARITGFEASYTARDSSLGRIHIERQNQFGSRIDGFFLAYRDHRDRDRVLETLVNPLNLELRARLNTAFSVGPEEPHRADTQLKLTPVSLDVTEDVIDFALHVLSHVNRHQVWRARLENRRANRNKKWLECRSANSSHQDPLEEYTALCRKRAMILTRVEDETTRKKKLQALEKEKNISELESHLTEKQCDIAIRDAANESYRTTTGFRMQAYQSREVDEIVNDERSDASSSSRSPSSVRTPRSATFAGPLVAGTGWQKALARSLETELVGQKTSQGELAPARLAPDEIEITFSAQDIGLILDRAYTGNAVVVAGCVAGSQASRTQLIDEGMVITAIRNLSVLGKSYSETIELLNDTRRPMTVRFKGTEEKARAASKFVRGTFVNFVRVSAAIDGLEVSLRKSGGGVLCLIRMIGLASHANIHAAGAAVGPLERLMHIVLVEADFGLLHLDILKEGASPHVVSSVPVYDAEGIISEKEVFLKNLNADDGESPLDPFHNPLGELQEERPVAALLSNQLWILQCFVMSTLLCDRRRVPRNYDDSNGFGAYDKIWTINDLARLLCGEGLDLAVECERVSDVLWKSLQIDAVHVEDSVSIEYRLRLFRMKRLIAGALQNPFVAISFRLTVRDDLMLSPDESNVGNEDMAVDMSALHIFGKVGTSEFIAHKEAIIELLEFLQVLGEHSENVNGVFETPAFQGEMEDSSEEELREGRNWVNLTLNANVGTVCMVLPRSTLPNAVTIDRVLLICGPFSFITHDNLPEDLGQDEMEHMRKYGPREYNSYLVVNRIRVAVGHKSDKDERLPPNSVLTDIFVKLMRLSLQGAPISFHPLELAAVLSDITFKVGEEEILIIADILRDVTELGEDIAVALQRKQVSPAEEVLISEPKEGVQQIWTRLQDAAREIYDGNDFLLNERPSNDVESHELLERILDELGPDLAFQVAPKMSIVWMRSLTPRCAIQRICAFFFGESWQAFREENNIELVEASQRTEASESSVPSPYFMEGVTVRLDLMVSAVRLEVFTEFSLSMLGVSIDLAFSTILSSARLGVSVKGIAFVETQRGENTEIVSQNPAAKHPSLSIRVTYTSKYLAKLYDAVGKQTLEDPSRKSGQIEDASPQNHVGKKDEDQSSGDLRGEMLRRHRRSYRVARGVMEHLERVNVFIRRGRMRARRTEESVAKSHHKIVYSHLDEVPKDQTRGLPCGLRIWDSDEMSGVHGSGYNLQESLRRAVIAATDSDPTNKRRSIALIGQRLMPGRGSIDGISKEEKSMDAEVLETAFRSFERLFGDFERCFGAGEASSGSVQIELALSSLNVILSERTIHDALVSSKKMLDFLESHGVVGTGDDRDRPPPSPGMVPSPYFFRELDLGLQVDHITLVFDTSQKSSSMTTSQRLKKSRRKQKNGSSNISQGTLKTSKSQHSVQSVSMSESARETIQGVAIEIVVSFTIGYFARQCTELVDFSINRTTIGIIYSRTGQDLEKRRGLMSASSEGLLNHSLLKPWSGNFEYTLKRNMQSWNEVVRSLTGDLEAIELVLWTSDGPVMLKLLNDCMMTIETLMKDLEMFAREKSESANSDANESAQAAGIGYSTKALDGISLLSILAGETLLVCDHDAYACLFEIILKSGAKRSTLGQFPTIDMWISKLRNEFIRTGVHFATSPDFSFLQQPEEPFISRLVSRTLESEEGAFPTKVEFDFEEGLSDFEDEEIAPSKDVRTVTSADRVEFLHDSCDCNLRGMRIGIVTEVKQAEVSHETFLPVFTLDVSNVEMRAESFSSFLRDAIIATFVDINAKFYNRRIGVWEFMMEPWTQTKVSLTYDAAIDHFFFDLDALSRLNINISEDTLGLGIKLFEEISGSFKKIITSAQGDDHLADLETALEDKGSKSAEKSHRRPNSQVTSKASKKPGKSKRSGAGSKSLTSGFSQRTKDKNRISLKASDYWLVNNTGVDVVVSDLYQIGCDFEGTFEIEYKDGWNTPSHERWTHRPMLRFTLVPFRPHGTVGRLDPENTSNSSSREDVHGDNKSHASQSSDEDNDSEEDGGQEAAVILDDAASLASEGVQVKTDAVRQRLHRHKRAFVEGQIYSLPYFGSANEEVASLLVEIRDTLNQYHHTTIPLVPYILFPELQGPEWFGLASDGTQGAKNRKGAEIMLTIRFIPDIDDSMKRRSFRDARRNPDSAIQPFRVASGATVPIDYSNVPRKHWYKTVNRYEIQNSFTAKHFKELRAVSVNFGAGLDFSSENSPVSMILPVDDTGEFMLSTNARSEASQRVEKNRRAVSRPPYDQLMQISESKDKKRRRGRGGALESSDAFHFNLHAISALCDGDKRVLFLESPMKFVNATDISVELLICEKSFVSSLQGRHDIYPSLQAIPLENARFSTSGNQLAEFGLGVAGLFDRRGVTKWVDGGFLLSTFQEEAVEAFEMDTNEPLPVSLDSYVEWHFARPKEICMYRIAPSDIKVAKEEHCTIYDRGKQVDPSRVGLDPVVWRLYGKLVEDDDEIDSPSSQEGADDDNDSSSSDSPINEKGRVSSMRVKTEVDARPLLFDDRGEWILLDSREDIDFGAKRSTKQFFVPEVAPFNCYRIEFTSGEQIAVDNSAPIVQNKKAIDASRAACGPRDMYPIAISSIELFEEKIESRHTGLRENRAGDSKGEAASRTSFQLKSWTCKVCEERNPSGTLHCNLCGEQFRAKVRHVASNDLADDFLACENSEEARESRLRIGKEIMERAKLSLRVQKNQAKIQRPKLDSDSGNGEVSENDDDQHDILWEDISDEVDVGVLTGDRGVQALKRRVTLMKDGISVARLAKKWKGQRLLGKGFGRRFEKQQRRSSDDAHSSGADDATEDGLDQEDDKTTSTTQEKDSIFLDFSTRTALSRIESKPFAFQIKNTSSLRRGISTLSLPKTSPHLHDLDLLYGVVFKLKDASTFRKWYNTIEALLKILRQDHQGSAVKDDVFAGMRRSVAPGEGFSIPINFLYSVKKWSLLMKPEQKEGTVDVKWVQILDHISGQALSFTENKDNLVPNLICEPEGVLDVVVEDARLRKTPFSFSAAFSKRYLKGNYVGRDSVTPSTGSSGLRIPRVEIHLRPWVVILNALPYALEMKFTRLESVQQVIGPGEELRLCEVHDKEDVRFRIPELGTDWTRRERLEEFDFFNRGTGGRSTIGGANTEVENSDTNTRRHQLKSRVPLVFWKRGSRKQYLRDVIAQGLLDRSQDPAGPLQVLVYSPYWFYNYSDVFILMEPQRSIWSKDDGLRDVMLAPHFQSQVDMNENKDHHVLPYLRDLGELEKITCAVALPTNDEEPSLSNRMSMKETTPWGSLSVNGRPVPQDAKNNWIQDRDDQHHMFDVSGWSKPIKVNVNSTNLVWRSFRFVRNQFTVIRKEIGVEVKSGGVNALTRAIQVVFRCRYLLVNKVPKFGIHFEQSFRRAEPNAATEMKDIYASKIHRKRIAFLRKLNKQTSHRSPGVAQAETGGGTEEGIIINENENERSGLETVEELDAEDEEEEEQEEEQEIKDDENDPKDVVTGIRVFGKIFVPTEKDVYLEPKEDLCRPFHFSGFQKEFFNSSSVFRFEVTDTKKKSITSKSSALSAKEEIEASMLLRSLSGNARQFSDDEDEDESKAQRVRLAIRKEGATTFIIFSQDNVHNDDMGAYHVVRNRTPFAVEVWQDRLSPLTHNLIIDPAAQIPFAWDDPNLPLNVRARLLWPLTMAETTSLDGTALVFESGKDSELASKQKAAKKKGRIKRRRSSLRRKLRHTNFLDRTIDEDDDVIVAYRPISEIGLFSMDTVKQFDPFEIGGRLVEDMFSNSIRVEVEGFIEGSTKTLSFNGSWAALNSALRPQLRDSLPRFLQDIDLKDLHLHDRIESNASLMESEVQKRKSTSDAEDLRKPYTVSLKVVLVGDEKKEVFNLSKAYTVVVRCGGKSREFTGVVKDLRDGYDRKALRRSVVEISFELESRATEVFFLVFDSERQKLVRSGSLKILWQLWSTGWRGKWIEVNSNGWKDLERDLTTFDSNRRRRIESLLTNKFTQKLNRRKRIEAEQGDELDGNTHKDEGSGFHSSSEMSSMFSVIDEKTFFKNQVERLHEKRQAIFRERAGTLIASHELPTLALLDPGETKGFLVRAQDEVAQALHETNKKGETTLASELWVDIKCEEQDTGRLGSPSDLNLRARIFLTSFGISLVHASRKLEVFYLIAQRLRFKGEFRPGTISSSLCLGNFQIDNHDPSAHYEIVVVPNLLEPIEKPVPSRYSFPRKDFFNLEIIVRQGQQPYIEIETFNLVVTKLIVNFEERFLANLMQIAFESTTVLQGSFSAEQLSIEHPKASNARFILQVQALANFLYVYWFNVATVKILFNCNLEGGKKIVGNDPISQALRTYVPSLSIQDLDLSFEHFTRSNDFQPSDEFLRKLINHVIKEVLLGNSAKAVTQTSYVINPLPPAKLILQGFAEIFRQPAIRRQEGLTGICQGCQLGLTVFIANFSSGLTDVAHRATRFAASSMRKIVNANRYDLVSRPPTIIFAAVRDVTFAVTTSSTKIARDLLDPPNTIRQVRTRRLFAESGEMLPYGPANVPGNVDLERRRASANSFKRFFENWKRRRNLQALLHQLKLGVKVSDEEWKFIHGQDDDHARQTTYFRNLLDKVGEGISAFTYEFRNARRAHPVLADEDEADDEDDTENTGQEERRRLLR